MSRADVIALAGLAALAAAMGVGRFAFTPILPMMQGDAGIGVVEAGWLASANYLGYLLGALSAVALPLSAGAAVRIGLLAVGATTLAMGHTAHMGAWLALRLLAGVASAWVLVFASAWCLEQFQAEPAPGKRARLGATLFAGVGAGIAIAGAFCLVLILRGSPSSLAWTLLGMLALTPALALPRAFGAPSHSSATRPAQARWPPDSARLIFCYGAFGFGYIIPATFLSTMARDLVRDPSLYGWSWPVFGIAAAASTFAAVPLRRHMSDRRLWLAGHVVMAVGVVMPLLVGGLAGIIASALLVGGTFMVVTMVGMQEARRVAGADARRLMAAMTSAFAAGQIAGPLAVSALASAGAGYDAALVVSGALLIVAALALIAKTGEKEP
jgi:MFS family permease